MNTRKAEMLTLAAFCVEPDLMAMIRANAATALAMLASRSTRLERLDLAQSWSGDPVVLLRRNADDPREAALAAEACATCEDVSLRAIATLANASHYCAEALVERAAEDERELVLVGNVIRDVGSTPLVEGLEEKLGRSWMERYHRALTTTWGSPHAASSP